MTNNIWKQILEEVTSLLGTSRIDVNKPATESELGFLETSLNLNLPHIFKEYLSTFNGQAHVNDNPNIFSPFIGYNYFLSIHDILEAWNMMNELFDDEEPIDWVRENKIKPLIWSKKWIPFTDYESSQRLILDLDPGMHGKSGQVFCYHSGMNYEEIVADSLEDFADNLLRRLQQKAYKVSNNIIMFSDYYI